MITGNMTELQFDLKKMPGETGPCYMVLIDGMFRGYNNVIVIGESLQILLIPAIPDRYG